MLDISDFKSAERVFYYFEEISKIPHGSGNTEKIADYIEKIAISLGLDCTRDETNSLIIRKAATEGLLDRPTLILQGHTDMVLAKEREVKKDLAKEGLDLYRDGDFIRARGTTLGADDGIAVAYMLAILESKSIPHPPLEAVFTSDEETGLFGAWALKKGMLSGKRMINLDMDVEGSFTAGCAGGIAVKLSTRPKTEHTPSEAIEITVSGLRGGHSGAEIGDGRENAIKILAELLKSLKKCLPVRLYSLNGGNAENAIPKDATAVISAPTTSCAMLDECIKAILEKYKCREGDIEITKKSIGALDCFFTDEDTDRIISLLDSIPSGVVKMSEDIDGLVETSLNLGTLSYENGEIAAAILLRSSKDGEKYALAEKIEEIIAAHGASSVRDGDYPGWEYKKCSPLREMIQKLYRELYAKEAEITVIHAGLECGIFSALIDGLDCVSMGPNIFDIHTVSERLSISSSARVWDYLCALLSKL